MTRTSLVARTLLATVAATAVGLAAATPASAHTNNLYTVLWEDESASKFGTVSKSDGIANPLGSALAPVSVQGLEVHDEKGYLIGYGDGVGAFVSEWNHVTGAEGTRVAAYYESPAEDLMFFSGLDTLADGTLLTLSMYVVYVDEDDIPHIQLSTIDPGTGAIHAVVDLQDILEQYEMSVWPNSIATHPTTGVTYVFFQGDDGSIYFVTADVAAGTHGELTALTGPGFEDGFVQGVDFDADGTLYFIYGNGLEERYELSKVAAGADLATAERQFISLAPAQYEDLGMWTLALTTEHGLANTGSETPALAIALVGGLAVFAGGVALFAVRRRGASAKG